MGRNHPELATFLNNLGACYKQLGKLDQAGPYFERALDMLENSVGANHITNVFSLNGLATLYTSQERFADAKKLFKRAITILEKALPGHPNLAIICNNYADMLMLSNQPDESERMRERAKKILEKRS